MLLLAPGGTAQAGDADVSWARIQQQELPAYAARQAAGLARSTAALAYAPALDDAARIQAWRQAVVAALDAEEAAAVLERRVAFGDEYGEVVEIGLRSIRIRTRDGSIVTVPNVVFLTDRVPSSNAGNLHMMVALPFYVAATEDFQRVRRIVAEAAATSP